MSLADIVVGGSPFDEVKIGNKSYRARKL